MDQELIRKAPEAIWLAGPGLATPFHQLHPDLQALLLLRAEAALKVFYEHTERQ